MLNWNESLENARQAGSPEIVKTVLGNKIDLNDRKVSSEEGANIAKQLKAQFFEVSAKESLFVDVSFMDMAKRLVEARFGSSYVLQFIRYRLNLSKTKDELSFKLREFPLHRPPQLHRTLSYL